jgi:hypothetical protein
MSRLGLTLSVATLVLATLSHSARAVDFKDPTTSFFSVEKFTDLSFNREAPNFTIFGYYTPKKGALSARVSLLPTIKINPNNLIVIDQDGNKVKLRSTTRANNISSIQLPLSYSGKIPNIQQGAAISSTIQGTPLKQYIPSAIINTTTNTPHIYRPASAPHGPIAKEVIRDTNLYIEAIAKQDAFVSAWKGMRVETVSIEGMNVSLLIDGDVVAERKLSGSAILSSGRLPKLIIKEPSQSTLNRIRGGTYEVEVTYQFRDAKVSSIVANHDFSKYMSQYIEATRHVATRSRSSGWKIFNIGSRRKSVSQSIKETNKSHSTFDSNTNTTIEIDDADSNMIAQFESEFFPKLSQLKVITAHQTAARELQSSNPELAKAHLDYATAIVDADENKSFDAVGAAADLGSGNYASFIAKGVQFHNNKYNQNNSFHRVISAEVREGKTKSWTSVKRTSVRRSISVILSPEETATIPWSGLCGMNTFNTPYRNRMRTFMLPTCLMGGGPLARAGVEAGMLIYSVNNKNVTSFNDWSDIIKSSEPGDQLRLKVLAPNGMNTQTIRVTLEAGYPKTEEATYGH